MNPSGASDFDETNLKDIIVSRDLKLCHPELVKRFIRLSTAFAERNPGKTLLVTTTYRSPAEQRRLYIIGRNGNPGQIVTNTDGFQKRSQHNFCPARAIDFCVLDGGKAQWTEEAYWPVLPLAREFGLISGLSWVSFQDPQHLELAREIT